LRQKPIKARRIRVQLRQEPRELTTIHGILEKDRANSGASGEAAHLLVGTGSSTLV
jgi:hypothetical protein